MTDAQEPICIVIGTVFANIGLNYVKRTFLLLYSHNFICLFCKLIHFMHFILDGLEKERVDVENTIDCVAPENT